MELDEKTTALIQKLQQKFENSIPLHIRTQMAEMRTQVSVMKAKIKPIGIKPKVNVDVTGGK